MNPIELYRDYLSILPEQIEHPLWTVTFGLCFSVNIFGFIVGTVNMFYPVRKRDKRFGTKVLAGCLTFFCFWLPYVIIYGAPVIAICSFVYLAVIVVEELL